MPNVSYVVQQRLDVPYALQVENSAQNATKSKTTIPLQEVENVSAKWVIIKTQQVKAAYNAL
jgi:hypothetical protein